ncbi:MAG: hypothetical protein ACYDBZ_05275 [Steroidobacteraceae bacterium]
MAEDELAATGEGRWSLDLWNGHARFSAWFYERLPWPAGVERKKLSDLRPSLPEDAWESLLLAIRDHLERQLPLDMQLRAQLPDGRFECWQVQGLAERNAAGQPVYLAGSMREVPR